ncbi:MAG: type 4a pilus biogenesis protein PilO [Candidatus Omnitrophica bacterium]|nr:type 4a pilus biogenesis protein PilO [Candidatus Omnitrophota bacterium]
MNPAELKAKITGGITKIYENNPFLLIGGVILVVLLVDYFLVMQFQLRILGTLNPKISERSQELKTTQNNVERMPQYKKEAGRIESELARASRRIKTKEEIPLVLKDISRIANIHSVRIEEVFQDTSLDNPILENSEGKYYILPVEIQARSSYHDFGRFLNQLENEGAIMNIPEFKIAASSGETAKHSIRLVINTVVLEKN